jgi:HEPN domain-containing protein
LPARSSRDLADVLLRRAQDDATAVAEFGANQRIADSVIGLHAQQAIEKSLKAVMAVREVVVPRTHDLDLLAERIEADGLQLPVERDRLAELTAYAGPLRYEDLLDAEPLDREDVTVLVDSVCRGAEAECSA